LFGNQKDQSSISRAFNEKFDVLNDPEKIIIDF